VLTGNLSENLFVNVTGIERNINAGDILADEGLHPAFRLRAIEGVANVAGEGVAEILQVGDELFQRGFIFVAEFFPGGVAAKVDFIFVPAGEGEPAKTQDHFLGVRRGVGANGLGAESDERAERRGSAVEEELRFAARHEPGSYVATGAGIHTVQGFAEGIEFVDFDGEAFAEGAETVRENGGFSLGKNQSQGGKASAFGGLAGPFEPKQSVGEAAFEGVLRFAIGDREERDVRGTAAKDSASVDFGKRMLEILGDRDFFEVFVGKLFRQYAAQLLAVAFARKIARAGGVFEADDFQALWPGTTEALDGEGEAVLGIAGDGDDAAGDVAVFRPQVKQRLSRISADFPGERRRGGEAAAVFADFDGAGDKDVLEAGAQVFG
jgi:hypothetical protein